MNKSFEDLVQATTPDDVAFVHIHAEGPKNMGLTAAKLMRTMIDLAGGRLIQISRKEERYPMMRALRGAYRSRCSRRLELK